MSLKQGDSVRGRYHPDVIGIVIGESRGFEGTNNLFDVQFPQGTKGTSKSGKVIEYMLDDLEPLDIQLKG